jgi:hypothetical protein
MRSCLFNRKEGQAMWKQARSMSLVCALFAALLVSCKKEEPSVYIYSDDDPVYEEALKLAKEGYPEYFEIVAEAGIEDHIRGMRVFGSDVECVYFHNSSSIIIEIALPLYCFEQTTGRFKQAL